MAPGALLQQRLTSSRECSTSYVNCHRPCVAVPRRVGLSRRTPHLAQRVLVASSGQDAAIYPSSGDGLQGAGLPAGGELAPPLEDPAATTKEQSGTNLSESTPQSGLPKVPWGAGKIFQVMVLWLLAYIIIGQVAVPAVLSCLGVDRLELNERSHALLHLCLDFTQLGVTLGILWSCLREYQPLKLGLFRVRWKGWWWLAVLVCCLTFPGVDWLAHQSMGWFPSEWDANWASNLEHSLSIGDWVTNVAYFGVVSLCAPIWEEAIFRGFLLTSLLRYMPTPAAVAVSSIVFAMCHFRLQTFLPLLVLGGVFSAIFIRTNNLIPPILLHSAWNMYVLVSLVLRPG